MSSAFAASSSSSSDPKRSTSSSSAAGAGFSVAAVVLGPYSEAGRLASPGIVSKVSA